MMDMKQYYILIGDNSITHRTGIPKIIGIISLEMDNFDKAVKPFIDDKHLSLFLFYFYV